ncbi:hypothetical protein C5C95_06210 [Rathayibacter sp. AY1B7]|uniref:hypothetical protein n=1 Tax=Rathayibacter sp. AY1B7 TaxID=2080532 RepID=UPI000CE7E0C0|nr:hypothetical protein [Rathayibacter sp. AY1B7]PPH99734.1 hypothetical protein C5C95_06210 [Rathayibacter sp. AY1B7]
MLVTVNGLAIHHSGRGLTKGFFLEPGGFTGWDGGVDIRFTSVERDGQHGEYDLPSYLGARVTSFSGYAVSSTPGETAQLGEYLTGIVSSGASKIVSVERDQVTQWARGKLATALPRFDIDGSDPRLARWQIQLRYPDPRKYGEERPFEQEAAFHFGNFPAIPRFEVEGDAPNGYTINGPEGRTITVTRPCVVGEVHSIDLRDTTLRVNGEVVYGGISRPGQWTISNGDQVQHTLSGAGGATLRTYLTDTYV